MLAYRQEKSAADIFCLVPEIIEILRTIAVCLEILDETSLALNILLKIDMSVSSSEMILFHVADCSENDVDCTVDAGPGGIDDEVVVFDAGPVPAGIMPVMVCTAGIDLHDFP